MKNKQSGNVLIIILIAVVLFAALSYAVLSSSRSGGNDISPEKARAYASAIIQNIAPIRAAIIRVETINGCTDETLDFNNLFYRKNNDTAITPVNATAPLDKRCNIFDPAGGGVVLTVPPAGALGNNPDTAGMGNWKTGHGGFKIGQIKGVGTDGPAGTASANDVYLSQNYLNKATCMAINDLNGVPNSSGDAPSALTMIVSGTAANGVADSFTLSTQIMDFPARNGALIYCTTYGTGSAQVYQMHAVVIER
ncbi:hypothetical protein [Sphingomonas kyeonggiensis]|uniref:Uncharacterized protein n=1 Tax=Sphingomonas kyeonggiensis TaxID=1268553 RepID=A0A7W6JXN0_9SPHN|nr:hypothetical protein [Sphingomonas kyeonggiensis]MBB4101413.1 hypothetical protein [Sphingomonas kyeonggiensis]